MATPRNGDVGDPKIARIRIASGAAGASAGEWKELPLHTSVGEILTDASVAFNLAGPLRLRSAQNNVITDVALIQPNDLLVVTPGTLSPDHSTLSEAVAAAAAAGVNNSNSYTGGGGGGATPPIAATTTTARSQRTSALNSSRNSIMGLAALGLNGSPSSLSTATAAAAAALVVASCNRSEWVELNVGGRIFATSRGTLTSVPDSMLAAMFSPETNWSSSVDRNGAFLIDRSPECFAPLLHFLRTGNIVIDPAVPLDSVLEEARFFQLTPLVEVLEEKVQEEIMRSQISFTRREFIQKMLLSSHTATLRCQGLVLIGIDFSRLDLRNCNFAFTDFRGANLRQANCDYCSFECCQMSNVNFSGASLICAMFSRANLEGAIMRGCNFEDGRTGQGAVFEGANLKGAQLEDSNLSRANLRVASLREANLRNCNLRLAVLAGADAQDANLENCNMDKVNLRGANLVGAKFHGATPVHSSAFMH